MEPNKNCIFCRIIKGEINSKNVYEDKNFIGILDANPKAEGHTIIISKKHFRNLLDLPNTLGNELFDAIKKISLKLIDERKAEGVNIVSNNEPVSGQVIFHTHVHIIPRKKDDGLRSIV
ncbi:MAG: HIT domain-containing protein [Nanoarchaeota archaeon]